MFWRRKQRKKTKEAIENSSLQKALERASFHHSREYQKIKNNETWEKSKEKAKAIKDECLEHLPSLIQEFIEQATLAGANVHTANNSREALYKIEKILKKSKAKLIVKAKSMVSEEIHLNPFLEKKGYHVIETDLGEWIIQLSRDRPSHITAPALHMTKEKIANLLSQHFNKKIPPDSQKIAALARKTMRKYFQKADVGISGANLAVAESGTLVILSNEGNARLVTSLPPVHIAIITVEKIVKTLEQAVTLVKTLVPASSGSKLTAYVSFITGPSRTTDIEKELIKGAHGPKELHIIILDNGRLNILKDKDLNTVLRCLKCGGCLLECPVFQSLGGHFYGGPVYPGGIGILLTAITQFDEDISSLTEFCADCKKCEKYCPVGIPIGELILHLKQRQKPIFWEKAISLTFRNKYLMDKGAEIFSVLQKLWQKKGSLKKISLPWTKDKYLPLLNLKANPVLTQSQGPKIYFFEGCLARYYFPEIRESVTRAFTELGYHVLNSSGQVCCGAPSHHLGITEDVRSMARKNYESFEKEQPDFILTVCPTGNTMLKKTSPRLIHDLNSWTTKIFDFTEFIVKQGHLPHRQNKEKRTNVFYHYPCHTLNKLELKEEPIQLLKSLGYFPVIEKEPLTCCGFCGVFSLRNPELSHHLWMKKLKKIKESGISVIATDCPGCLFQLRSGLRHENEGFKVYHTSELYALDMKRHCKKTDVTPSE